MMLTKTRVPKPKNTLPCRKKVPKNVQKVLLSAHVMRVSVSRMRLSPSWLQTCCCLQGGRQDLTITLSCQQLQIEPRA